MRIAIVGGGVSGLTAYLFLKKHLPEPPSGSPHEYVVYDAYPIERRRVGCGSDGESLTGAGLGIGPNGMRAIRDLDEELHNDIIAHGFPSTNMEFFNSRGWKLGSNETTYKFGDNIEAMVMIGREAVFQCILSRVPTDLIVHKSVSKVYRAENEADPLVEFTDGSSEPFDLVIGADGVHSKVRQAVLDDKYAATYTGLFGIGGFLSSSLLNPIPSDKKEAASTGQCVMTFGANGFFGYTPCSTAKPVKDAQLQRKEVIERGDLAFWWSSFEQKDPSTRDIDMDEQMQNLRERHMNWNDPAIQRIVQNDNLECIPTATWVMPKAPTWVAKRIVLIGDAAHALPSTSGQGISQGMLDGQALALILSHHLTALYANPEVKKDSALNTALEQYVQVRKPMVEKILDLANKMGGKKKDMKFVEEMLTYGMLKIIFTLFGNSMQKPIMEYDVKKEVDKVLKTSS